MSKKKKNIRRKKSNNLLKGMAAAGAVVGGGTIFAGNNAVYAAENEQGVIGSQSEEQIIESQSVSESTTESLSQVKSETSSYENEGAVETSAVEGNTVQTNHKAFVKRAPRFFNDEQINDEQNIMTVDETEGQKGTDEETVPDENKTPSEETVADENEMTSEETSTSISTAELNVKSESDSASDAKSEALIESEKYSNTESESLSKSEASYMADSKSISLAASESASLFNSKYQEGSNSLNQAEKDFESNSNRIDKYEELVVEITKLQNELKNIHESIQKQSNPRLNAKYDGNRTWYQVANELSIKLAEYYFFQEYGVGQIKGTSGDWRNYGEGGSYNANYIYLEYTDANGVVHKGYFDYIEANDSGYLSKNKPKDVTDIVILKKETAYVNYETKTKCNYYYSKTDENHNTKHYLKMSGDSTYKEIESSRVTFNPDGSISVDGSLTFKKQNDRNKYGQDLGHPPFVAVPNEYDKYQLNKDTIKGKPYFSTMAFDHRDTKYDKENKSELNSVSQSLSKLLSESVSASKSNVDDSTSNSISKVNSKSESTKISNSNSTSLSEKESLIESTSLSLSKQKISLSQSAAASTSASESASNSKSASESESASGSKSLSESKSASESASASKSESESASLSGSESVSTLESDTLSTSVSESLSNSLGSSESNSLSSSESASASDSFATSVTTTTIGGDTSYRRVVVDTRAPLHVAPRVSEEETVEDDVTPKAKEETIEKEKMPKSTLDVTHRVWWSWIPIVGALISSNETRKRRKEEKEESKDKKVK